MRVRGCVRMAVLWWVLCTVPAAAAPPDRCGDLWYEAFSRGAARRAAKVTVPRGLQVGIEGVDRVIADQIARYFTGLFRKIRKRFRGQPIERTDCTGLGRELGYMAVEWRSKDEKVSAWIQKIPLGFCGKDPLHPPRIWLVTNLTGDVLPHALVLVADGDEDLVTRLYAF